MKGEFVGVKKSYSIECFDGEDWYTVNRTHPDFALAVAALQALIQPKPTVPFAGVHPGVGLRWCGEEEAFGWVGAGTSRQYLYRFRDGQVEYLSECGEWIHFGVDMDAIFEAGRRYERWQS
jgi:hypothetical protein